MASQVYFVDADGVGEWYECVSLASPGQSPATHPAKWARVQIPAFLESAVVDIAAGYAYQSDGQGDRRRTIQKDGRDTLYQTFIRHRPRGDYRPLPVHLAQ